MSTRQTITASFHIRYAAEDGEDACILALSNESEMVACDGLGNVSDVDSIEGTAWTFYVGNTALDASNYTYEVVADGCTVTTSVSGSVGTIAVTAMSADTATVTVKVTYNGTTYTRTYTLTKAYGTTVYDLVVTPGVLSYDADGNYTGGTLTVGVRVTEKGTSTIYYNLASTGTLRTTYGLRVYRSTKNVTAYGLLEDEGGAYTPTDTSASLYLSAGGLTLSLYKDGTYSTGTLQDEETLETVQDGAQGSDGSDGTSVKIVGKADYHFGTWATAYSYTAGFTDTGITILCGETGDLSDGTTATATGPYVHAVDDDGNYTVTLASEGDCYIVDSGNEQDGDGDVWYATADGWEDLGAFAGADAEYYELRDAATYSANYASAITAVISSVADDGTITEGISNALYVVLAHVKGEDTTYVTGATVTAYLYTTVTTTDEDTGEETTVTGWQAVTLTRSGAVYSYTGTAEGIDISDLPASIRVTATYNGSTYYLTVPVTLAASNYFNYTQTLFTSVYQNANSYSTLSQTATDISARVTAIEGAGYATESYVDQKATEITSSVTSTLDGYVTAATLEIKADSIVAEVKSDYSSAGLSITDDTIELTASKVYITDSDGNTVALFSDGKVSADLIDAESIFTTYLSATNAVLGNVTIEGSIVYAQNVLNKGTEEEYLHTVDSTCGKISDSANIASYALDVCTLDGTLVIERVVDNALGFHLPFMCKASGDNNYLRGYTKYNSSAWRAMTFTDFRRLIGRELTIINNTGLGSLCLFIGNYYFIGNDTAPTALTDGIYYLPAGGATFAIDYSSTYGYLWRVSVASDSAEEQTAEEYFMDSQGVGNWDLPEECDSIDKWYVGENGWNSSGTTETSSTRFCPTSCITVPSGAATMSVQTAASKTIDGTTYHYSIDSIFAGTSDDGGASLSSVTTILAQSATELTGEGTLKTCGDGTVYRADVDIEGYEYVAVTFRVYVEDGDSLTAENATSDNVDIGNLKILFY